MASLVGRVGGDEVLARAIRALRENGIAVDESRYLKRDDRIYLVVVLGNVWQWVVDTFSALGATLHDYTILPIKRLFDAPVLKRLRQQGNSPIGLNGSEASSGVNALLQMLVTVETLREFLRGFDSLLFAFQRMPEFERAVRAQQAPVEERALRGERERSDAEVVELIWAAQKEESSPVGDSERELGVAFSRGDSLEEALQMEAVVRALQDPVLQFKVIEHLSAVNQLARFLAEYERAQGNDEVVMTPQIDRVFSLLDADDLVGGGALTEVFARVMEAAPIPARSAGFFENKHVYESTGRKYLPRRLRKQGSIADMGGRIEETLEKKFDPIVSASGRALPSLADLARREEVKEHTVVSESRTSHLSLHIPGGEITSLDELLKQYARPPLSKQPIYMKQAATRLEYRESSHVRRFTHPPQRLLLSLDRTSPGSFDDRPLHIPMDEMVLPAELSGGGGPFILYSFIAYVGKEYAFYRQVEGEWYEVINNKVRGVTKKEATEILSRNAVLLDFAA